MSNDVQEIQADRWHIMDMTELMVQRDLILDKMSKLASMVQGAPNPTIIGLHAALEHGLQVVNSLIEQKTT